MTSGFTSLPASAIPADPPSIFDLLYKQREVREITLVTDLQAIQETKPNQKEIKGILTFKNHKGEDVQWKIGLETRGKFRFRICDFPPLRIDFSKGDLREKGLAEYDDMKLVSHCLNVPESKDFVIREYFIYQLHQLLFPYFYRTQLVKVTYIDTLGEVEQIEGYGILIEDTAQLEHRQGGTVIDTFGLKEENLYSSLACRHALFQYLIGNTDWDLAVQRNVKLFRKDEAEIVPIPYDFDFSGIVNASYAIPNPNLGQINMQQRFFLGSKESGHLDEAVQFFLDRRELVFAFLKDFQLLRGADRRTIKKYLKNGFRALENGEFLQEPETDDGSSVQDR
jgi:hypothetical protein